jgi:hypothetical protein
MELLLRSQGGRLMRQKNVAATKCLRMTAPHECIIDGQTRMNVTPADNL